ncbi:Ribosomal large subunit pseudouridine synthase B [Candidatus Doolittlea endobia]|uniref:Pseudouridine synthase n=1 Tax=Candidatus Doolittlea endobia TaxID=1778262 RepID=A0A143WRL4_9ENTR|nr:Ribosomal large subunit pseudouridine synthase B [Candidatus Doolittlea endobia]
MSKSEKLQKVLSRVGQGSRRKIEAIIEQGRVSVDGKVAILGGRVDVFSSTKIRIDGRIISIRPRENTVCRVLAYYKPIGELCAYRDPKGRPTVFNRLPHLNNSRWIAIGRLDINTSGLLLFTTDGELSNRLMHPRYEIEREYAVRVFGTLHADKQRQLIRGVQLDDGQAAFRSLTFKGGKGLNKWYNITLKEGRNREVRRLWEAVGMQVNRLIRVRYGGVMLPKGLPRGGWAELSLATINYLREKVQLPLESCTKLSIKSNRHRLKVM